MPKERRPVQIWARIKDTPHVLINGDELVPREAGVSVLDDPLPPRTGVFKVSGHQGIDLEGRIDITQELPFPLFLLSIAQETEIK